MANDKKSTRLYKVRNGYTVMKGNQAVKEGNVRLTDEEHALQSWKVEEIVEDSIPPQKENKSSPIDEGVLNDEISNTDRAIKKSRFNRVIKPPKG